MQKAQIFLSPKKNYSNKENIFSSKKQTIYTETTKEKEEIEEYKHLCTKTFYKDYGHFIDHEDYLADNVVVVVAKYNGKIIAGNRLIIANNGDNLLPIEKVGTDLSKIDPHIKNFRYAEFGKLFVTHEYRGKGCVKILRQRIVEEAIKRKIKYLVAMSKIPFEEKGIEFDTPYLIHAPYKLVKLHRQYVDLSEFINN